MATTVVSAVFDKYNALTATLFGGTVRPPLQLDEQPATGTTGAQRRVPYVVLKDNGFVPEFQSDGRAIEKGVLVFELYAEVLDTDTSGVVTVDKMALAIKYAGGAPSARLGFDWGTLTITGYTYPISLRRTREQRGYAGFNFNGQPVHKCTLTYEAIAGLKAS